MKNETPSSIRPIKKNGYSNATLHAKRNRKHQEAMERQAKYDKLTPEQKLKELGATGSSKQRAKLTALIAAKTAVKVENKSNQPLTDAEKSAKVIKRSEDAVNALPKTKKKAAKK